MNLIGKIELLENEIAQLSLINDTLQSHNNTLTQRCEQYAQAYDNLQHQLKELLRNRFGKKSERYTHNASNPQLSFFDDNQAIFTQAETKGDSINDTMLVAAHTRKNIKKLKKSFLAALKSFLSKNIKNNARAARAKPLSATKRKNLCTTNQKCLKS